MIIIIIIIITEVNDHPSSLVLVIGFLDRDYCYKSIATKISQDAGLAQNPYTGRQFLPFFVQYCTQITFIKSKASPYLSGLPNIKEF